MSLIQYQPPSGNPSIPRITIDEDGDLIVGVYKKSSTETFTLSDGKSYNGVRLASFKVSHMVLIGNSTRFAELLRETRPGLDQPAFLLCEKHVDALRLLFRIIHKKTSNFGIYSGQSQIIWNAIQVNKKYGIKNSKMIPWFNEWLSNGWRDLRSFEFSELPQLVALCYHLDHPKAFRIVTRRLVYESPYPIFQGKSKHIFNTVGLHVRHEIIGALQFGMERQRTRIGDELWIKTNDFLDSRCPCKEAGLFSFMRGLKNTGIWPMGRFLKGGDDMSIESIFQGFQHRFKYDSPNRTCPICSQDMQKYLDDLVQRIRIGFRGLCLDCINPEKASQFYEKCKIQDGEGYDAGCRIKHGQLIWYFSAGSSRSCARDKKQSAEGDQSLEDN